MSVRATAPSCSKDAGLGVQNGPWIASGRGRESPILRSVLGASAQGDRSQCLAFGGAAAAPAHRNVARPLLDARETNGNAVDPAESLAQRPKGCHGHPSIDVV